MQLKRSWSGCAKKKKKALKKKGRKRKSPISTAVVNEEVRIELKMSYYRKEIKNTSYYRCAL